LHCGAGLKIDEIFLNPLNRPTQDRAEAHDTGREAMLNFLTRSVVAELRHPTARAIDGC
jgi:hypothetical protein